MLTDKYLEIDAAIAYIHQHINEPLPLSRIASHVAYSPYHFARMFKEKTGLSPIYYVSSIRLQKAKDLLLRTNLSVRDIGLEIGQQSLGTFTTRFTERVGVTPSDFRNQETQAQGLFRSLQNLGQWQASATAVKQQGRIEGSVQAEVPFEGIILIGLFAKPIPEGMPLYGTLLFSLGEFCFTGVKPGIYYLMATSVSWRTQTIDFLLPYSTLRSSSKEPIVVEPSSSVPHQHVMLHAPRLEDPPILVSLPLLMNSYIKNIHSNYR